MINIMLANMVNQPVKHLSTKEYFSLITYFNEKVRENGRRTHPQGRHN
jgi:ABC-type polysaccharide transport system permease subunit